MKKELGALKKHVRAMGEEAQLRLEAKRLLEQNEILDFPAMFDRAIAQKKVLRLGVGEKRIMVLLLESMASALLAGFTNNLAYREEVKNFAVALRLQPSAKALLNLLRGTRARARA
jgi:hypothetical protein